VLLLGRRWLTSSVATVGLWLTVGVLLLLSVLVLLGMLLVLLVMLLVLLGIPSVGVLLLRGVGPAMGTWRRVDAIMAMLCLGRMPTAVMRLCWECAVLLLLMRTWAMARTRTVATGVIGVVALEAKVWRLCAVATAGVLISLKPCGIGLVGGLMRLLMRLR
jgi:hypothetical protein